MAKKCGLSLLYDRILKFSNVICARPRAYRWQPISFVPEHGLPCHVQLAWFSQHASPFASPSRAVTWGYRAFGPSQPTGRSQARSVSNSNVTHSFCSWSMTLVQRSLNSGSRLVLCESSSLALLLALCSWIYNYLSVYEDVTLPCLTFIPCLEVVLCRGSQIFQKSRSHF